MNWVQALSQDELPEGARQVVQVGEHAILLLHHQGQIYAMSRSCPHLGGGMDKGKVTDQGTIICHLHHSEFDLRTGEVKVWAPWPPGVGRVLGVVSQEKPLPVYPTKVEAGAIWVGLPESK